MTYKETNEDDEETARVVKSIVSHAGDPKAQRTAVFAALRMFRSMGYRAGYEDAMHDALSGKDRRVVAHVN